MIILFQCSQLFLKSPRLAALLSHVPSVRKQISHIIFSKLSLKEATNWWLRYMLAQPVNLDFTALYYLLRYYTGTETIHLMIRRFKSFHSQTARKNHADPLQ